MKKIFESYERKEDHYFNLKKILRELKHVQENTKEYERENDMMKPINLIKKYLLSDKGKEVCFGNIEMIYWLVSMGNQISEIINDSYVISDAEVKRKELRERMESGFSTDTRDCGYRTVVMRGIRQENVRIVEFSSIATSNVKANIEKFIGAIVRKE